MKTKIKTIVVIWAEGVRTYEIGQKYNGLVLVEILDNSVEDETGSFSRFIGRTAEKQLVFELINAPIDVQYCEDKPK